MKWLRVIYWMGVVAAILLVPIVAFPRKFGRILAWVYYPDRESYWLVSDLRPYKTAAFIANALAWTVIASLFIAAIVAILRKNRVISAPGSRPHAWAGFLYSKKTMERIFDPMLVDMREEYFDALAKGRKWKARWVRLSYYWAFAKTLPFHALVTLGKQIVDLWKLFGLIR